MPIKCDLYSLFSMFGQMFAFPPTNKHLVLFWQSVKDQDSYLVAAHRILNPCKLASMHVLKKCRTPFLSKDFLCVYVLLSGRSV